MQDFLLGGKYVLSSDSISGQHWDLYCMFWSITCVRVLVF